MGESVNEALRSRYQTPFVLRTTTGTSDLVSIEPYFNHTFQTTIQGTATVNYRASLDGVNFTQLASHTSNTIATTTGKYRYLVANVSAVSGTVTTHVLSGL